MNYFVVYDISDDRIRERISEFLKNYGLKRIQKSAFFGCISNESLTEISKFMSSTIATDSVLLIPLCLRDVKNIGAFGKPFDISTKTVDIF